MAAPLLVCPECGESYHDGALCPRDGGRLASADTDPLLGQYVGSYRIACRIGAGGMGEVYKGVHPSISSRVAIKVLGDDWARQASVVERFFSEARAVNLIRHEHIVNVLDLAWLADGRPYIVMEFLDGKPLSALIAAQGALPYGSLALLIAEVADALEAAHAHGIVHRDLKPDNLFVTPSGRPKVLDFGIAKLRSEDRSPLQAATATGSILGTPCYMSPEQALGRPVDFRSDLYALGVILFEGVTGRPPFVGDAVFDVLRQHLETPPTPPEHWRADLPPSLSELILRALAKRPEDRPGSARELGEELRAAVANFPADSLASLGVDSAPNAAGVSALARAPGRKASLMSITSPSGWRFVAPGYQAGTMGQRDPRPAALAVAIGVAAIVLVGGLVVLGGLFWFGSHWLSGRSHVGSNRPSQTADTPVLDAGADSVP